MDSIYPKIIDVDHCSVYIDHRGNLLSVGCTFLMRGLLIQENNLTIVDSTEEINYVCVGFTFNVIILNEMLFQFMLTN